jgi:hypothetical protein
VRTRLLVPVPVLALVAYVWLRLPADARAYFARLLVRLVTRRDVHDSARRSPDAIPSPLAASSQHKRKRSTETAIGPHHTALDDLNRDVRHALPVPQRHQRARRVVLAIAQTVAHHLPF